MKTIGLIGGMSWESTVTYYQVINRVVAERLGGLHSARIVLYSVDFDEIERCQSSGAWDRSAQVLAEAARALERAGADMVLICTNTMHKVAGEVVSAVSIPLLHIADMTADELERENIKTVGLLGTRYTMEQDFYTGVLEKRGITVLTPDEKDRSLENHVIFDELCRGEIRDESRAEFLRIIHELAENGAQGVILGCTEIGLLVCSGDTDVPLFDTTLIHARGAAQKALAG